MLAIISARQAEITELCRRFHVRRLDVFGSATTGRFDAAVSDLDFAVELELLPPVAYADAYFGLRDGLVALFERPVDLVTTSSIVNPYFRASLQATREPLYAA